MDGRVGARGGGTRRGLYVRSWATGARCPSCLQNVQTLLDLFNLYCCFASGPCKAGREGAGNSANSAESIQQLQKVSTISNRYCGESQSHSTASRHVPHYTFDADLSFVNQKVNLRYGIDRPCLSSFEKHTTPADIQNCGGFGAPITMPIGPDALSLEPWAKPSCRENIQFRHKCLRLSRVFTEGAEIIDHANVHNW
jgi:hypothetical protein